MRDVVIIGGGHNGLVTAALLAKAGVKPLVLERASRVGGCAITTEIAPGFRCPTLAHHAAIDRTLVKTLDLERHGLHIMPPLAHVCAPTLDGRALTLWVDRTAAAADIAPFSARDAARYPEFVNSMSAVGDVLRRALTSQAPAIDPETPGDLIDLLKLGRAFRRLDKRDAYRLLRWLPMSAADLAAEWFESEPLRAAVAGAGILGCFHGPRSAGSGAVLLLRASQGYPLNPGWNARGGMGALSDALAASARQAGAEIRTGVEVTRILVREGAATGVVLASGEEIAAHVVVSNADPRRTLLGLVDPVHLEPGFLQRVRNIRMRGALAKVNVAVSSLPRFSGLAALPDTRRVAALSGSVRLGASVDAIERAFDAAKYGRYADEPWIELSVPSVSDPDLAPGGGHVVSAYVQFTPYTLRDSSWEIERDALGAVVTGIIERYAPGFRSSIVGQQVITPLDLERTYGLTEGHPFHGEIALDQLLFARPLLGLGRHTTPIQQLFLCGTGTHPGTGLDGRSGVLAAKVVAGSIRR